MALTGPQKIPFASQAYFYGNTYEGSAMESNVVVLHTTEGTSLPSYSGGSVAPNVTAVPDFANKKLKWYQHFDVDRSARALVNASGGVETNTLNAFQIELTGSCDPARKTSWGSLRAGEDYLYWPDAPDWALAGVGELLAWLNANHGVKLQSTVTFKAYPASYGTSNGVRLSGAQWTAYYGVLGHQHVPENCVHPDTEILMGDCTWKRAGDLATGDRIVGFDEENVQAGSTPGRRFRESFATVHGRVVKDCYRVTMSDGAQVTCSADHKWLVNLPYVQRGSRVQWVEARHLDPARHRIKTLGVPPWAERRDKESGYLAGAIDCDGSVVFNKSGDSAVLFGQSEGRSDVLERFTAAVREYKLDLYSVTRGHKGGYPGNGDFTDVRIKGGLWKTVSFLAQVGPEKFEQVRDNCWSNRAVGKATQSADIASVEHVGSQEVVSLETTSRTYVAAGLLCHNTHGDPGDIDVQRILAFAKGEAEQEEDVALTGEEVWKTDIINASPPPYNNSDYETNKTWTASYALSTAVLTGRKIEAKVDALAAKVDAISVSGVDLDALAVKVADEIYKRMAG